MILGRASPRTAERQRQGPVPRVGGSERECAVEVEFSRIEVFAFSIFISFELGFSCIQSVAQVDERLVQRLRIYSLVRFAVLLLAVLLYVILGRSDLLCFIALITAASAIGFLYPVIDLRSHIPRFAKVSGDLK